jgi:alpha-aminoadipate carrier protein LysW
METLYCPDCDGKIVINPRVQLGQKLVCPHCDAELEVISIDPVELDWAYDWSWDDDEDEDDEDDEDW